MKKLFIVLGLVLLMSCQSNSVSNVGKIRENLTYFKDETTGLCFATINSYTTYGTVTSITCVPCDSLKKLGIK